MNGLAEISERDATGGVAALYGQIRGALGVPIVNLVFRHMATLPGCLEWVAGVVSSLGVSGKLEAARNEVFGAAPLSPATALAPGDLAELGVDSESAAVIRAVIDAYNRANPVNLIVFSAIAQLLDNPTPPSAPAPALTGAPRRKIARSALPPAADLRAIDSQTRDMLAVLARQAGETRGDLVPTIYRQLVAWPGFLRWTADFLAPYVADGSIDTSVANVRRVAFEKGIELARNAAVFGKPPMEASVADLSSVIARFSPLIARMIVIGGLLDRALPRLADADPRKV